ncbi:uncharacterized protein LOC143451466 isoform X2 [Clavelina lepadiformis]|uniref:uncharacterized protein LOC143451466 isoform X2 n=1 Tax=Clavelina lepadiformis TaxID=159417 RepID=UPI004041A3D3
MESEGFYPEVFEDERRISPPPPYESIDHEIVDWDCKTIHMPASIHETWVKSTLSDPSRLTEMERKIIQDMKVDDIDLFLYWLETKVEKRSKLPAGISQSSENSYNSDLEMWDFPVGSSEDLKPVLIRIPSQSNKQKLRRWSDPNINRNRILPVVQFDEVKVEWDLYSDDCYTNTKAFPQEVKDMLPHAVGDRVPINESPKKIQKPSSYHLRRHSERAENENGKILRQKENVFCIPVYHINSSYQGKNISFWIVGKENKVYGPCFSIS